MKNIKPVRGTHDLYGKDLIAFKKIEKIIAELAYIYDYKEIITPIFESNELFKKPLGEHSDVVLKEMYTFEDRNKSFLTLRPEYTTPMIRAAISNNLFSHLPLKLYGMGPMFRRERPQKGRYRQFNQINFEIFGTSDPFSDIEIIFLANDFLEKLNLQKHIKLYINSLGETSTLLKYKKKLSIYYNQYKNDLSKESQEKIDKNPLRILDSKNENDTLINKTVPRIEDLYSKVEQKNFDEIQNFLTKSNINFKIDNTLVRGLDYYCHTVFEFKTDALSAQNTLIGGGRYNGLIKILGGPDIPGVGWACGVERLIMMMKDIKEETVLAQLIILDKIYNNFGLELLLQLRKLNLNIKFDYKYNLKKSLSAASELRTKFAIIIGENEQNENKYTIKNLIDGRQQKVNFSELVKILKS